MADYNMRGWVENCLQVPIQYTLSNQRSQESEIDLMSSLNMLASFKIKNP